MVLEFVSNVIIIDDNEDEIKDLISILDDQDISSMVFTPSELKGEKFKKNRQLFFLDLSLDDSKKIVENIALIRKLLKDTLDANFGNYGIILWSKHQHHIDTLKEKLQEDRKNNAYPTPVFVVGLDKTKYIKQKNYKGLFQDIESSLTSDKAAIFFLEWSNSVKQAENTTISKIYSLMPDYKTMSDDFAFILKKLALNYTGIEESENTVKTYPLHIDAFKSFDDILHAELINCQKTDANLFPTDLSTLTFSNSTDLSKIYAQLNTALLIDENNIDQSLVIPGNVYEIKGTDSKFKSDKSPQSAKNLVIEITPPCDFSNSGKRIRARLIGGFLVDIEPDAKKQIEKLKCKKDCFYVEVFPIILQGTTSPQLLILDFRYFGDEDDMNLQNIAKYKILFRTKQKLFADILQKFSSHAARLGLSVIH